jgi:hypothetical protein
MVDHHLAQGIEAMYVRNIIWGLAADHQWTCALDCIKRCGMRTPPLMRLENRCFYMLLLLGIPR